MPTRKIINFGILLKKAIELIRYDYVVILPYLISSFLIVILGSYLVKTPPTSLTDKVSTDLLIFSLAGWVISLLAQATTIFIAQKLRLKKTPDIAESFLMAIKYFFKLTFLLLLAMFLMGALAAFLNQLLKNYFLYAAIPILMFILTISYLLPVIILTEKAPWLYYYKIFFNLIRNNTSNFIRFFLSINLIYMFIILLISIVNSSKITGQEVITPLLQGISGVFITLFSIIYYQEAKTNISTNA